MRAMWSGLITFGLVNIPVVLLPAINEQDVTFDYLHKKDHGHIRYARICRAEGQEVPFKELAKGFQIQKGNYVMLNEEDFEKASQTKKQAIEVFLFADEKEIDTKLYDKPFFLEPTELGRKPYALFRQALVVSRKVGIVKFVLRTRDRLGILKAEDDVIMLYQLRYANEIRDKAKLNLPEREHLSQKEVELAVKLIDQLSGHFDSSQFKDNYKTILKKIIDAKIRGREIQRAEKEELIPTEVPDLLAKLKESLQLAHPQKR